MNNYDNRARLVFHFGREEAEALGHTAIDPEHLLLGLLREGGTASGLLTDIGVTLDEARSVTAELTEKDNRKNSRTVQVTPETALVMKVAGLEAERLGSKSIHTEHLLLALFSENDGVCGRVLARLTQPDKIRLIQDAARSEQAA